MEQYKPVTTATPTTPTNYTDTELKKKNNNGVYSKIEQNWGIIGSDRDKYYSEYDKVSNYVNQDVTKTDEYKSAFDKIMPEYDLKAMQGRNNAVASGGASNGGNIDSYAAANALRQQAALKAKGQTLAHQIGLDTYNSRVSNARNLLSDLGVYQKDSWNAMGNLIDKQANEGQRLFENDLAEKTTMAEVTGYVPNEWTIKNDAVYNEFLNEDGTFKTEKENVDIQALINSAKANGDTETAKKLSVVRAKKMLGNYGEFGKYINEGDVSFMSNQQTEAGRQFDKNDATVRETLKSESADTRYGIDAEKQIAAANNQTELSLADKEAKLQKDLLYLQSMGVTEDEIKAMDTAVDIINNMFEDDAEHKKKGDMIVKYGNGSYGLASGVSVSSYLHPVVKYLYDNPNITTEQMEYIIESIGFKDAYNKAKEDNSLDYIFK